VIVVVAYGQLLPKELIEIPPQGCVNLHGSLLPKYRGAAPIHRALINGDIKTGVTTMLINERMDAGDILLTRNTEIRVDDDTGHVSERLRMIGADLMVETLDGIEKGENTPVKQEEGEATYAPKIVKEECRINWSRAAGEIHNFIRGLTPFPGAHPFLEEKRMIISGAELRDPNLDRSGKPGEITGCTQKGISVAAGEGTVLITGLRPEGKRDMKASEFIAGHAIKENMIFT